MYDDFCVFGVEEVNEEGRRDLFIYLFILMRRRKTRLKLNRCGYARKKPEGGPVWKSSL